MNEPIHYVALSLTNVRAFGGRQALDLRKEGKPSRWCVIIGENGVGKTTLLQAFAALRPVPSLGDVANDASAGKPAEDLEWSDPEWAEPELADYQNDRVARLVRQGDRVEAALEASLAREEDATSAFTIGYEMRVEAGRLKSAGPLRARRKLTGRGPLVIAYGASRHAGYRNMATFEGTEPTEALFDEAVELLDPDEVAERLDYLSLDADRAGNLPAAARYGRIQAKVVEVVAALIPDLTPDMVLVQGAGGIRVRTRSGIVQLRDLSLGAQTTVAWIADLIWRLQGGFPASEDPFAESAVVLVDEVDLHLHPLWQRSLRGHLLRHFPRVQFIVTTHSPIVAQESVARGDPIFVVGWQGSSSVVRSKPFPAVAPRLDEVVTGLFDLETSLADRFEALLRERRDLIRRSALAPDEKVRLLGLNRVARAVQAGVPVTEADLEEMMTPSGTATAGGAH